MKNDHLLCDLALISISFTFASTFLPGRDLADVFTLLVAFVADDDEAFAARLFNGVLAREEDDDGEDDAPIDTNFLREGVAALELLPDAEGTRGVEVDDDDFEGVRETLVVAAVAVDRLADEDTSIALLPLATRSSFSSSSSVALVSILARGGGGLRSPIAPPAINSSS